MIVKYSLNTATQNHGRSTQLVVNSWVASGRLNCNPNKVCIVYSSHEEIFRINEQISITVTSGLPFFFRRGCTFINTGSSLTVAKTDSGLYTIKIVGSVLVLCPSSAYCTISWSVAASSQLYLVNWYWIQEPFLQECVSWLGYLFFSICIICIRSHLFVDLKIQIIHIIIYFILKLNSL